MIVTVEVSPLLFMGDQLTVERARNTAKSRVTASSAAEALEGLHAECVFLQVNISLKFRLLLCIIFTYR